jgi:hypothetical protein
MFVLLGARHSSGCSACTSGLTSRAPKQGLCNYTALVVTVTCRQYIHMEFWHNHASLWHSGSISVVLRERAPGQWQPHLSSC